MPRKSAKMVRKGHWVSTAKGESRVTEVRQVVSETVGVIIEIHLANGEVWRRTPGAKIDVTRTK